MDCKLCGKETYDGFCEYCGGDQEVYERKVEEVIEYLTYSFGKLTMADILLEIKVDRELVNLTLETLGYDYTL